MKKLTLIILILILSQASLCVNIPMTFSYWLAFKITPTGQPYTSPGIGVFEMTAEGLKLFGTGYRQGLGTHPTPINNYQTYLKTILLKWKANGGGQFMGVGPSLITDTVTWTGLGITNLTSQSSWGGSYVITNDLWYYTRITINNPVSVTCITSTGNYDTYGGSVIQSMTKSWSNDFKYFYFGLWDAYASTSAYAVLNEVIITTSLVPVISTSQITSIGLNTATGGGNVSDEGASPVTARGVCWNTTGSPTVTDSHTTDGSGIGSFTSNLTGLTPCTEYYVRAYATNSSGTAYGEQVTFTTQGPPVSVLITASNNPVCSGDTVCLTASIQNGGSNPNIEWYVKGNLNEGLIAYYPFNGNANDESGNGNNATEHGTFYSTDRNNNANSACLISGNSGTNGSCKYVEIPNIINGLEHFTLSLWVDEESMSYWHGNFYISFGEYFGLGHIMNTQTMIDNLAVAVRTQANGIIQGGYPFNPSFLIGFQHYVLTFNGISGEFICYHNGSGILVGTFTPGPAYAPGTGAGLGWGSYAGCCTRFNGKIDDVRIYNRALTFSEIQGLFHEGDSTFCYVPSDGDTVCCIVTSSDTCATNNPTISNSIIMEVNPSLPISVSVTISENPVCTGDTVSFTASVVNGGINPDIHWSVNGNINEGLMAYYRFNENTNDESGNGNHGTPGGDYQYVPGLTGKSFQVISHDGCDNDLGGSVTLPNFQFSTLNSFSYSLWVKDEGIKCGVAAYLFFRDDTYGIPYAGIMRTDNTIDFMAGLTSADERIVVPYLSAYNNTFVHYCLVYDQGISTAYINGQPVGTKAQPNNVDGVHSAIAKSWYVSNTTTRLTGTIDQVRIYDRALSSSDVMQLFNEGDSIYTYVPSDGDTVYCVVTSYDTCSTNNPDTSNIFIMSVVPYSDPVITGPDSLCTGIQSVYQTNGGMSNYQWTATGNPIINSGGTSGDSTITLTWNDPGNFLVSVKYTNLCNQIDSATFSVHVNNTDTLQVSITASSTLVCAGDTVIFTPVALPVGENLLYQWYVNDSLVYTSGGIPENGLVAWYPFSGNADDASGNNHNGAVQGATLIADRFNNPNSAYSFDGFNDHVEVNNGIDFSNIPFTVSCWAKRYVQDNTYDCILGQGPFSDNHALHIGFRDNVMQNRFTFAFYNNDLNASAQYSDTQLHHWVCIFDAVANGREVYRDGILVASDISSSDYLGSGNLYIGLNYPGNASYFNGSIDDIRIYNRIINPSEIQKLYQEGISDFRYAPSDGDNVYCVVYSQSSCTVSNPDTSNLIIITVNPNPPAPVSGGNLDVCSTTLPATLSVIPGDGNTADWYDAPSGGNMVQWNSATFTTNNAGTYYAQARTGVTGCVSSTRTAVTLTVIPANNIYYEDSDEDGYGNPSISVNDCDQPSGYVSNDDDCNDQNPLVYPGAQHFNYTGNAGYETSIVSPPTGTPYTFFHFQADYFDLSDVLPATGYPKLILDYEGNGIYTDPYDRTLIMTQDDPNDLTTVDGKRYIAHINGLQYGTNWKTRIITSDGADCFYTFGPFDGPDILQQPNIYLFANDITFSNYHPDPSDNIIVYATIHNESDYPAENFTACLVNQAEPATQYPDITVTYIPPHESQTIQWLITTPSVPAWCPMQVKIDYTDVILETNELDNSAVRPFLNGDFQLPGGIACDGYVSPMVVCPEDIPLLSGSANYYGTAVPLPDYSVAGATVEFQIIETTASYIGYTNSYGDFYIYFNAPLLPGTYHIAGTVTDFTLTGTFTAEFSVTDCSLPDLIISSLNLPQVCLEPGAPVSGSVTVKNIGQATASDSYITFWQSGGTPSLPMILAPPLGPGESFTAGIGPVSFPYEGDYTICATADGTGLIQESNESNNTKCTTVHADDCWDLPDIIPVSGPSYSWSICLAPSTSFTIYNDGCMPTGPFVCEIIATPPVNNPEIFYVTVPNINPKSHYLISIPYGYSTPGYYCFEIRCDTLVETGGVVEECNETNNVAVFCRTIGACKPNLTMDWCTSLDVLPENPQYPGTVQLIAGVRNTGFVAVPPPIKVRFEYIPGGETFDGLSNKTLEPGQTVSISVIAPVPPPATTLLCASADPDNEIDETIETDNGACDSMCYEFHPVGLPWYCGTNFWESTYQKNQTIRLWTGLFVEHLYRAGPVKVKFEVSGPGITGTMDLGDATLEHVSKICYGCPYTVLLPASFTFPDCGTYTFTMTSDPGGLYYECNELNNVLVVNVNVTCPCVGDSCYMPNLTFPNCKGLEVRPVNPFYPDDCELVAHVLNNGNEPAYPPVIVKFTYNTGGIYLGYYWNTIDPGEAVEIIASAPLPPPATTMLTACIDPLDIIDEWNENDNCTAENMCWEFQPVAQCGPHFWDRSYMVGQSVYFSIGLAVSHLYDAQPVKVKFEMTGPGIPGILNLGNGYLNYATRLCYSCPAVVVLPYPVTFFEAGLYTVIITADPDNVYTECNENNNVFIVNVDVGAYLPDIRVLSQFINPSKLNPDPGDSVSFLMSYENIMAPNVNDSMEMKVLVNGEPFDSLYPVEGLWSGEHTTKSIPKKWSSLIPGIHIIRLIIDSDFEVAEGNETNNEATRAVIVGIAANPYFQSFMPSDTLPAINDQILITANVGNEGPQSCNTHVKFQYVNDFADTLLIGETSVIIPGHDTAGVSIPWTVADTTTTLIATIFETNVPEFNYDDNQATSDLGPGIVVSFTSSEACPGERNGTVTATATGGTEPYQFNWSNGFIGETLTDSAGNYKVTVYDNTGMSKTVTGNIPSFPDVNPFITGPDTLCGVPSTGNVYFTESGKTNYLWTISQGGEITDGGDTTSNSITVTWNTPGIKTVSVNYTDNNGCSAITPAVFQTHLLARPVPVVSGPDSICQYETGVIYSTDPGMTGYSWSISSGGEIQSGQGTGVIEVTWNTTGDQWVKVSYMGEYCYSDLQQFDVKVFEGTDPGIVSGGGNFWFGLEAFLTLEGHVGSVTGWQRRHNGGSWEDKAATGTIYSEIPDTTGTWDYRAVVQNGNCSAFHSDYATVNVLPVTITLNLKLLLEGLYNPVNGIMNKAQDESGDKYPGSVADKIKVRIARPFFPYSDYFYVNDVDLNQDGTCSITVQRAGYYYLVVNHRNSIETWSALPIYSLPDTTAYDFTTAVSQAFGDNMRNMEGVFTFWGGDVNQDGIVDASDMNPVDNAVTVITFGYIPEDVNGDGIVDGSDMNLVDNNTTAIIVVVVP